MFDVFADEAIRIGAALTQSHVLCFGPGMRLDLSNAIDVDFLRLTMKTAAKQHSRSGEDLLTFVDRVSAMIGTSAGRPDLGGKTQAALHLLRAVAMLELLQSEWRERFARHAPLRRLTEDAMAQLVSGFVARLGGDPPVEVRGAFPCFWRAVREAWQPMHARRGLLLWLTKRA